MPSPITNTSSVLAFKNSNQNPSYLSAAHLLNTTFLVVVLLCLSAGGLRAQTWAEKLGYPKDARVLILHVDDAGMSLDSNEGAIKAMTDGVANSVSVMM